MNKWKKFWVEWVSPYSVHILNLALSVILYFILKFAGVYTWIQFTVPCATATISTIINIIKDARAKEPVNLISMSFNYMLEGGVDVNNILDILIGNKQNKRVFKSSKSLFKVIQAQLKNGEYEEKRLIAESIGALYKINRKHTKQLIIALRNDEPQAPWNDDIRRRVIEELDYVGRRDKDFIIEQVGVKDDDSIYTVLAIFDIIFFHKVFSWKERERLYNNTKDKLEGFGDFKDESEEWSFIDAIKDFAEKVHAAKTDRQKLEDCLKEAFNETENKYIKILISKNIHLVCTAGKDCARKWKCVHPECQKHILNLFDLCFDDNNHKNIRRSMAKEKVCHCMLHCLTQEVQYRKRITENIWRIVKDRDYIIPNTFLDYGNILSVASPELYKKVIEYFTDNTPIVELAQDSNGIVPEDIKPYLEIIKETQWKLYLRTIFYYLDANKQVLKEAEKAGENKSILYNKIRLKRHAERVDKNIQALKQYMDE